MRKHGKRGTLTSRFIADKDTTIGTPRRRTQVSLDTGRQTYKWSFDSDRPRVIKH